jgi:Ca-activated chloride channel family protein
VAALWARARIADLLDKERRGASADEIRDEIVKTALMHHLVSKHTSLVAVDKTPSRLAGDPLRKDQVPNLMAHGQSSRAIFGFPATATDGPALRKSGLLTLLAAMLILVMSAWQRKVHRGLAR